MVASTFCLFGKVLFKLVLPFLLLLLTVLFCLTFNILLLFRLLSSSALGRLGSSSWLCLCHLLILRCLVVVSIIRFRSQR